MKKIVFNKIGILSVAILSFVMCSCGGSSGGGDEEDFEFTSTDLTGKYWYANPFLSSAYNKNDAVIVYRFEGGGILKRQELSGLRDEVVGSWSLSDNELVIEDGSVVDNNRQEWFIQSSSTSKYLKLNSTAGSREFYTDIEGIVNVTADAYVVNELRLVNNVYESAYRMEYMVYGEDISKVTVLPDVNASKELDGFTDFQGRKVFQLSGNDRFQYFDDFQGSQLIKFYIKLDNKEECKLDEQVYNSAIKPLDNNFITATHASGSGKITINWKAIDEDGIYYYVEILDKDANENALKFRSTRQPSLAGVDKELVIDNLVASELNDLNELPVGEDYYVKIIGFKYEDDIDANNSSNKEINIQAMTRFVFKAGQW